MDTLRWSGMVWLVFIDLSVWLIAFYSTKKFSGVDLIII